MGRYAIYDPSNGAIERIMESSDLGLIEAQGAFLECTSDEDDATHYVINGAFSKKQKLAVSHLVAGLSVTFLSLPANTRVEVQGLELFSDDEPTVIEFDASGTYEIRIYPPPQYTDEVVEVTVG